MINGSKRIFYFVCLLFWLLTIGYQSCQKPKDARGDTKSDLPDSVGRHQIAGNKNSLQQKVSVYLTFDDGPNWGSELVNKEAMIDSVYITVFVVGKFVFKSDDNARLFKLYKQNPFIEIGNHSFTHANSHYRSYYRHTEEVLKDFLMNYDTLHLTEKVARLPGRNCWRIGAKKRSDIEDGALAADTLTSAGYNVFGWDVEWRYDSSGKIIESAEDMIHKVEMIASHQTSFLPGNIVILCHDPMLQDTTNLPSLQEFVRQIKSNGKCQFRKLSDYPTPNIKGSTN